MKPQIETDGTVTFNGRRIGMVQLDSEGDRPKIGGVERSDYFNNTSPALPFERRPDWLKDLSAA